jgi:hypothetical protein
LLALVKERGLFGERVALWKILKKLGFKYKQVNGRHACTSSPVLLYYGLQRLMRNRTEERPFVYLDETWANGRDNVEKMYNV